MSRRILELLPKSIWLITIDNSETLIESHSTPTKEPSPMIPTLFFIFLSLFVIAFILVIVNMVLMTRNVLNVDFDNIGKGFGKHIIFGGIAGLFGMASLVTGIIWIVQVFAH